MLHNTDRPTYYNTYTSWNPITHLQLILSEDANEHVPLKEGVFRTIPYIHSQYKKTTSLKRKEQR